MRGRKPIPTVMKVLRGNQGKRPLPANEPKMPPAVATAPPVELQDDPVALKEWQRVEPMLRKSKTITQADRGALVALCQQWSRYLEANGKIASAGMVVKAPSGYPMPNPYLAIANKALGNCVKLWAELGLTPSSRSRVTATAGDQPHASLDEFLREA